MLAPRIDGARLWDRLMEIGKLGATGQGGVDRQALTEAESLVWRQLIRWSVQHRLRAERDDSGNLFLTLPGTDPALLPVLAGSHLDTPPTGGPFDGAWGVLAALEAACAMVDAGLRPLRSLSVVAWMNQAGSRFAPGMTGSAVFAGARGLESVRTVCDATGANLGDALDRQRTSIPLPRRELGFPFAAYLEAHIEQGPVLEATSLPIGVVTGIQGKKTWRIELTGGEAQAGTADMATRRDAVAALALIVSVLHGNVGAGDPQVKFTVGQVVVEPNAPSVVPGRASFSIDLRHPDGGVLERLGAEVEMLCEMLASPCAVKAMRLEDSPSVAFDAGLQDQIEASAAALGYGSMRLLSAAGHDAGAMAGLAPTAMIFIPCRGGGSQAAHEWAEPTHVTAGAEVLLATLLPLLQS